MKVSKKPAPRILEMRPQLKYDRERPNIKIPDGFFLVVDNQEKQPIFTKKEKWRIDKHLKTGDYSIKGFEDVIAIERKSMDDLFGTLANKTRRARFEREIDRMLDMKWCGLLIEGKEDSVYRKREFTQYSPLSVYGSVCSMELNGVHVYYATGRRDAQDWVLTRLIKFYNRVRKGIVDIE